MRWRIETKVVRVRPGALLNADDVAYGADPVPDGGYRYRYRCSCGHTGRWWKDGNLADGDDHLWRVHGIGD